MEGWTVQAAWFVWAACVFDFLDGFAARMLRASSPIGKELDSLADMVSFGVLPSVLMYQLMKEVSVTEWLPLTAFLLAIFSALRLARFNIDERQVHGFIGLPTPANALFITGLPLMSGSMIDIEWSMAGLLSVTLLFSWLMVSPLPLLALKFKQLGWKDNQLRFTLIAISVLLIALFGPAAIVLVIITYILLSLFDRWLGAGAATSK
jgi:CDP-diacylglycerol--serine O-phosphatidyltransferase